MATLDDRPNMKITKLLRGWCLVRDASADGKWTLHGELLPWLHWRRLKREGLRGFSITFGGRVFSVAKHVPSANID